MYLLENAPRDALCAFMLVCKCVLAFACMSTHVNLSVCVCRSQHTVCYVCVCVFVSRRLCRKAAASQRQMFAVLFFFFFFLRPLSLSLHQLSSKAQKTFTKKDSVASSFCLLLLSHNSHCCRGKWWHGTQWCRSGVGSKKRFGLFVWSWNLNIDIAASIEMFVGMMLRMWVSHTCDQDM